MLAVLVVAGCCAPALAQEPGEPEAPAERPVWGWGWDDGVHYRLELPFDADWLPETGPVLDRPLEKRLAFVGTIGVRLQVDAAGYDGVHGVAPVDGGGELRRLRFGTRGEFFLLTRVRYALDVEVNGASDVEVGDAYLWWRDVPLVQRVKIGNFSPPLSIESVTSNRDIVFMETALPVEAFGPARASGLEIGGPVLDESLTWGLAFVRTIETTDQGDQSDAGGRAVARLTWLPQDDRAGRRLTHLGLGASVLVDAETVRYETRPESHLAPSLVDTGVLRAADQSSVYGLELLHVRGPWLVMGEALLASLTGERSRTFWGAYGLVAHTLTGEAQPYDRASGILGRFAPARPFSWSERTWGALRIGARVSHIDLSDGRVAGGRETDLTTNLTWVLSRSVLLKLEYGIAFVRERSPDGDLHFVQTRLQIDFY